MTLVKKEVKMEEGKQLHFVELEPFRCFWQCLRCPFSNEDCLWDDPLIGMFDLVEYPEFFFWRVEHEGLAQPEPDNPMQSRCPRCYSIRIDFDYPYIRCLNCGYNEPLIDFPISYYHHLALEREFNDKS